MTLPEVTEETAKITMAQE